MPNCIDTEAIYPFGNNIRDLLNNSLPPLMNFSLWYNKFVPVAEWRFNENRKPRHNFDCNRGRERYDRDVAKNMFKVCDDRGITSQVINFYVNQFSNLNTEVLMSLLSVRHMAQQHFCRSFSSQYHFIEITAKLKSPMVVGIGEMHPSETSMIFDRNLGIPYIPASSIKGVVRFAKLLEMIGQAIDEGNTTRNNHDEEIVILENLKDYNSFVDLFGGDRKKVDKTESYKGKVIFLDAYPKEVPKLAVDIMNVHYGEYYKGNSAPSDNLTPNPIKFLVVAKGTEFIFRILVSKQVENLKNEAEKVLKKALAEEGVGAKNSLGYGLFEIIMEHEVEKSEPDLKSKILKELEGVNRDYNRIDTLFRKWQESEELKEDEKIAKKFLSLVRKKKKNGKITHHYRVVAKILKLPLKE